MVAEVEHPTLGPIKSFGVGPKFSLTPAKVRQAAPRLGENNLDIYRGLLGLSDREMEELRALKVI
ncbi:MAG: CoA transferase, partial [Candidatus Tectomicrobia bacterium]|nr:CoA transferase [Candidatus Tectomicrobia bacterium]